MNCSVGAAEQKAAQLALSVAEGELQRIKQRGCFTSSRDQAIMRNPDYRALPYPALANPIVALEFDTNNKYTAAAQSEGFTSPFVDEVTNQSVQARPTTPGMTMAGTGDLSAMAAAYLEPEAEQKQRIYSRIADSIRGSTAKLSEASQTRGGGFGESGGARATEAAQTAANRTHPVTEASQVTSQMLYGAATTTTEVNFFERCKRQCRGALYDLMHFEAIDRARLEEANCRSKLGYVTTREGRLPYLLLAFTSLLLVAYLGLLLFRR